MGYLLDVYFADGGIAITLLRFITFGFMYIDDLDTSALHFHIRLWKISTTIQLGVHDVSVYEIQTTTKARNKQDNQIYMG